MIKPSCYLASFVIPFFLRSAHRFFINSDNRLRPSLVIPPRRFLPAAAIFILVPGFLPLLLPLPVAPIPSKAAIAAPRRSLSFFKSEMILSISKQVLL